MEGESRPAACQVNQNGTGNRVVSLHEIACCDLRWLRTGIDNVELQEYNEAPT